MVLQKAFMSKTPKNKIRLKNTLSYTTKKKSLNFSVCWFKKKLFSIPQG